jgi:hypothetical protein
LPHGRCPVGAAAAVAPARGEPTAGSVGAAASQMLLLAHAATEYGAPASSPGGHAQDSPGWKRASAGCSPRAGRRCPSRWMEPRGRPPASTGKIRPPGADSRRSRRRRQNSFAPFNGRRLRLDTITGFSMTLSTAPRRLRQPEGPSDYFIRARCGHN